MGTMGTALLIAARLLRVSLSWIDEEYVFLSHSFTPCLWVRMIDGQSKPCRYENQYVGFQLQFHVIFVSNISFWFLFFMSLAWLNCYVFWSLFLLLTCESELFLEGGLCECISLFSLFTCVHMFDNFAYEQFEKMELNDNYGCFYSVN